MGSLGLEQKPTYPYTKNDEKALLAFEHPRIPSTSENPAGVLTRYCLWVTCISINVIMMIGHDDKRMQ